jgi:hypothetical protein
MLNFFLQALVPPCSAEQAPPRLHISIKQPKKTESLSTVRSTSITNKSYRDIESKSQIQRYKGSVFTLFTVYTANTLGNSHSPLKVPRYRPNHVRVGSHPHGEPWFTQSDRVTATAWRASDTYGLCANPWTRNPKAGGLGWYDAILQMIRDTTGI